MKISKALIIDEPWLGFILAGTKNWEMRSTATEFRGPFGLIRKGSGAVVGIAHLVDVGPALTSEEMIRTFEKHRIPEAMIESGQVAKWNTPWILGNVQSFSNPIPYRHKSGAVTWVNLDPDVTDAISASSIGEKPISSIVVPPKNSAASTPIVRIVTQSNSVSAVRSTSGMWGETEVTEGNITHNHFYMRSFLHRFPADLIGGSNQAEAAARSARVDWGGPEPVETDIDGEKKFFRRRGWIRAFFALNHAAAGDVVRVEEVAPFHYNVTLRKKGRP